MIRFKLHGLNSKLKQSSKKKKKIKSKVSRHIFVILKDGTLLFPEQRGSTRQYPNDVHHDAILQRPRGQDKTPWYNHRLMLSYIEEFMIKNKVLIYKSAHYHSKSCCPVPDTQGNPA